MRHERRLFAKGECYTAQPCGGDQCIRRQYVGKLVEIAETEALFNHPKHPYTEALISAVARHDPLLRKKRIVLSGEIANPANPPSGCYFHPRCRYAQEICVHEIPVLRDLGNGHWVSCHRADELNLVGLENTEG